MIQKVTQSLQLLREQRDQLGKVPNVKLGKGPNYSPNCDFVDSLTTHFCLTFVPKSS